MLRGTAFPALKCLPKGDAGGGDVFVFGGLMGAGPGRAPLRSSKESESAGVTTTAHLPRLPVRGHYLLLSAITRPPPPPPCAKPLSGAAIRPPPSLHALFLWAGVPNFEGDRYRGVDGWNGGNNAVRLRSDFPASGTQCLSEEAKNVPEIQGMRISF